MKTNAKRLIVITFCGILAACGGGSDDSTNASKESESAEIYKPKPKANPNGVGPIKELELETFNPDLAKKGEEIYTKMCTSCHKMDKRHVGPALEGILERRNPAWVMNMILNPEVMVKEDPVARGLLAAYLSPMANQNLTEEEARAVVEYFRQYDRQQQ